MAVKVHVTAVASMLSCTFSFFFFLSFLWLESAVGSERGFSLSMLQRCKRFVGKRFLSGSSERMPTCYFGNLYLKSPHVKYRPKISPRLGFSSTIPGRVNGCNCALFRQSVPLRLGSAVKHRQLLLATKKFLLWFFYCARI